MARSAGDVLRLDGPVAKTEDGVSDRAFSSPEPVRVLVVEDTPEYRQLTETALREEGFDVAVAADGEQALESAREFQPNVIVLDLVLPKLDGVEVCRQVRTFSDAYIVMVTIKSKQVDKLVGLSVGADDYLTKPFATEELVARIRAMLRRPRSMPSVSEERRFGDLVINPVAREVSVAGRPVELTRIEFDLLDLLSANPRVVFTRERLMERVWGPRWSGDLHLVDVHIGHLRRKLDDDEHRYVRTVRSVGFRMGTGS